MKIISWNVAGFRACLKKGFRDFFISESPDIICLQEVKAEKFQYDFNPDGYYEYLFPAKRKGYSGTLIYSKLSPLSVTYGISEEEYDDEGRTITLEFENFYLINVYVPNVKRDLSRMNSRMYYEDKFKEYIQELDKIKPVIICGDFNVAHTEADIKNAKQNIGNAGFTYEEREKFTKLLEIGLIDTFRYYNPNITDAYTWWSYIGKAREKNIGWRIDYFLISKQYIKDVTNTVIYKDILGSDHCPIGIEYNPKKDIR